MTKQDAYEHVLTPMEIVFAPPTRLSEDQKDAALEQYADALKDFSAADLAAGWRHARDANKRDFWPPIAALIAACTQACKDRREASAGRYALVKGRTCDDREQDWPGACMCVKCVSERRGKPADVWRAVAAEREKGERERAELQEWTKLRRDREAEVVT